MTLDRLIELLEQDINDDAQRGTKGPKDLLAFNFLASVCRINGDIIANATHDKIWLNVELEELEKLAEVITEEKATWLRDMGVCYDEESLYMIY